MESTRRLLAHVLEVAHAAIKCPFQTLGTNGTLRSEGRKVAEECLALLGVIQHLLPEILRAIAAEPIARGEGRERGGHPRLSHVTCDGPGRYIHERHPARTGDLGTRPRGGACRLKQTHISFIAVQ